MTDRFEVLQQIRNKKEGTSGDAFYEWKSLLGFLLNATGRWYATVDGSIWPEVNKILGISTKAQNTDTHGLRDGFKRYWYTSEYPDLWYVEIRFGEEKDPRLQRLQFVSGK
jgi:hypothetical protein